MQELDIQYFAEICNNIEFQSLQMDVSNQAFGQFFIEMWSASKSLCRTFINLNAENIPFNYDY